eukprot:jgi/Astpho2/5213/fgenesh1_pg.00074_%23_34_t
MANPIEQILLLCATLLGAIVGLIQGGLGAVTSVFKKHGPKAKQNIQAKAQNATASVKDGAKQAQVQANSTAQSFSKDASQKTKQAGQRAQNAVPQANGRK